MGHTRFDHPIEPLTWFNRAKIIIEIIINNKNYFKKNYFCLLEALVILVYSK